jgi:FAD/FMN-containing dehydrogenase
MLILLLCVLAPFVAAALNKESQLACQHFQHVLPTSVVMPSDPKYGALSTENWYAYLTKPQTTHTTSNTYRSGTARGSPTCIVTPGHVSDVQTIVSYLSQQKIHFAVRSGGHSPSPLSANTADGVLIDLSSLNSTTYDASSQTVKVGPGLRWGDVYHYLDQFQVTAVGGRVLDVGVGGLLLGGMTCMVLRSSVANNV